MGLNKPLWKSVLLDREENNIISFRKEVQFNVKKIDSDVWQLEAPKGNFSVLRILNKGNTLSCFCSCYIYIYILVTKVVCSYDVINKRFHGSGNHFEFGIVPGAGISSDSHPCFRFCRRTLPTSSTICTFENGAQLELCPINIDPAKNIYEYEIKNEKGSFTLINLQCKPCISFAAYCTNIFRVQLRRENKEIGNHN